MFPTTALYAKFQAAGGLVSTDSRQPQPGTLFFALNGPSFRGADFAAPALAQGASHAVTDDPAQAQADPARYTFAPDPLRALQALAREHRCRFRGPVLAITGSNGKTTTKELLTAVLATKHRVLATIGNLNNHIGVPLTLLRLRLDEHELAVVEMGANHRGEIESYCQYAEPTHGLITNIGKAHLEGFGGEEGVAQGKGELFRYLAARGGTLFVNTLDARLPGVAAQAVAAQAVAAQAVAAQAVAAQAVAVRAAAIETAAGRLVSYPGPADDYPATLLAADPALALRLWDGTDVAAQLTGDYNFPNLAAAAAVGAFFEVPGPAVAAALAAYNPQNNRSQVVRTARGNTVLLDAYNANPSSMAAALRSFAQRPTPPGRPRLAVLGDMFELGAASAAEHRALGELLAELGQSGALDVVLVGPEMAAAAAVSPAFRHFAAKPAAAEWLRQHPPQDQSVLLKGSRGMGLETLMELL